jgi:methyltransferase-like protein
MLSAILKSETAILVNIYIIRVFAQMREHFNSSKVLVEKLEKVEIWLDSMENSQLEQDNEIKKIFQILDELLNSNKLPERKMIGF